MNSIRENNRKILFGDIKIGHPYISQRDWVSNPSIWVKVKSGDGFELICTYEGQDSSMIHNMKYWEDSRYKSDFEYEITYCKSPTDNTPIPFKD